MVKSYSISLKTKGNADAIDITDDVSELIKACGLRSGIATLFSPSSTSALTTIEFEPGCLNDFRRLFDEIIDPNRPYEHNKHWDDGNGHSHIRASLEKPFLTIPFIDQTLTLGTWQQVIFIDFDIRPRQRQVILQIIGE
jgi:secondary thiamine-phosphate synthase enzyme